jgi:hypothetical protein
MELIENTALKITVPEHIVPHITSNIEKSEVIEWRGNLADMIVFWGVPEMTKLNQLVSFRSNLPSHQFHEIIIFLGCIDPLITKELPQNF